VQIAGSHRFDDFVSGSSETGGWTSVGPFINSVGYPVIAQVFSIEAFGERGRSVRFLGFTGANGRLSLPAGESDRNLVALCSDGSCAMALRGPASAGTTTIDVLPTGRALLHASLRPGPGGPEVLPIRFRWDGEPLPGLTPVAVRFTSASAGWEVRDLIPGAYLAKLDNQGEIPVVVPPNGWGLIH
jgi:hypothetical protein